MTRPTIVRADTLDLQDQDSPSAQDHSASFKSSPQQHVDFSDNLIGSHQASEIRQVNEERHEEERNLQQAWNASGESVGSGANGVNGSHNGDDDGKSINSSINSADSDAASDDDMMDRISSSPSIDDGECSCREALGPPRLFPLQRSAARWNLFEPARRPAPVWETWSDSSEYVTTDDDFSDASSDDWSSPETPVTNFFDRFFGVPEAKHLGQEYFEEDPDAVTDDTCDVFIDDAITANEDDPPLPVTAKDSADGTPWLRSPFSPHPHQDKTWNPALQENHQHSANDMGNKHSTPSLRDFDFLTIVTDIDFDSIRTQSSTSFRTDSSRTDSNLSWFPGIDEHRYSPVQALDIDFSDDWLLRADGLFVRVNVPEKCLQSTEDIDFDFVYALHTFVATVEGQANATKGDTMVLLDDSNSYWWLVRVVKDSSIGYLPAEHIETPTERLARLNKHRNVDLSAAMLGDNAERSKNPLKKAMKRRAAKTVQFAPPTYVEASDYEYSDEEEDQVPEMRFATGVNGTATGNSPQQQQTATVDTIQPAGADTVTTQTVEARDSPSIASDPPLSPKILEKDEAAALTKSRKGTQRNADSFLKDDTAETRKFTLTPNLLREDSGGKSSRVGESSSVRMESPDPFAPDPKEEKRKKEKSKGMLSGLFKSKKKEKEKEKAKKKEFVNENDVERVSIDAARHSTASLPTTDPVAKGREVMERKTSQKGRKLQKQSPGTTPVSTAPTTPIESPSQNPLGITSQPQGYMAELEGSQVAYEAPTGQEDSIPIAAPQSSRSSSSKSRRVKPVQQRQALDDFDEQEEDEARASGSLDSDDIRNGSFMHGTEAVHIPMRPSGEYDSSDEEEKADDTAEEGKDGSSTPPSILENNEPVREKTSEKVKAATTHSDDDKTDDDPTPVQSKPQSPHPPANNTTAATTSAPNQARSSPAVGDNSFFDPQRQNSKSSSGSSRANMSPSPASTNATTWSDAGLRAWLDGDNDVKDMLTIIYDTSNVKPVGPDHPLMKDLFKEEQDSLNKMSAELDGLLHGFLQRKGSATVQATG